jgi:hypothetical protein
LSAHIKKENGLPGPSVSDSVNEVGKTVEFLKEALANAPAGASENAKIHSAELITIGEQFLKAQKASLSSIDRSRTTSKLSLEISFGRLGRIFRALGLGVVIYLLIVGLMKVISHFG